MNSVTYPVTYLELVRRSKRIPRQEIAAKLGVGQQAVNAWEQNRGVCPSGKTAVQLQRIFPGWSLEKLLSTVPVPPTEGEIL